MLSLSSTLKQWQKQNKIKQKNNLLFPNNHCGWIPGSPWQCPPGKPSVSVPFLHCGEASCVLSLMPFLTATPHHILLFSLGQLRRICRQGKTQTHIYPASWPKLSKLFLLWLVAHGYKPPPQPMHAVGTHPAWALPVWSIHLRGSKLNSRDPGIPRIFTTPACFFKSPEIFIYEVNAATPVTVWPWADYLISLNCSVLVCKKFPSYFIRALREIRAAACGKCLVSTEQVTAMTTTPFSRCFDSPFFPRSRK